MKGADRLELLRRTSAGKRLLPLLRVQLAPVLAIAPGDLDFLPLEESDEVRDRASRSFPPRPDLEAQAGGYPFLTQRFGSETQSRALLPDGEDVWLILPEADTVGVLRLSRASLNQRWAQLLAARTDGFVIVDETITNKMVLQIVADGSTGEEVVDLAVWGAEWTGIFGENAPTR